jgi:histidinol-phosphate aminotransferase
MTAFIKKSVLDLKGYASPPQKEFKAKLNQNESPFDVPQQLKDELSETIRNTCWNRYPVNESPDLKQKLADRHGVDVNQIILGNGSNQLFQTLLTATIAPGDKALYTPPTFSLYDLFMDIYEGELIEIMQTPDEEYPIDQVLSAIKEHNPKLIFICSPNNPTGYEVSLEMVERICKIAEGLVFFDEAYAEFTEQSAIPLLDKYENILISRTFSKAFSLAGLRFGYFIGRENVIRELRKVNLPYNINLFTEMVSLRLLDEQSRMQENIDFLKEERERMFALLKHIDGIHVTASAANFLLIKGPDNLNLFQELKDRGVLVRDVSSYPMLQGRQRITVGFKDENDLLLETLKSIMDDYK